MRVLLVAEWIKIPGFGGGSVHYSQISKALASLGHEVHLLCTTQDEKLDGVFLHKAPDIAFRPSQSKASAPLVEQICREHDIQVIHKRLDPGAGSAIDVAKKLGIPVVAEVNYNPFAFERTGGFYADKIKPRLQLMLRKRWAKKQFNRADLVTCVSDSIRESLARNGITVEMRVVRNGADLETLGVKADGSALRKKYGSPAAILVGELGPRHGIETILKAAARLPRVKFWLAGGIQKYAAYLKDVKKRKTDNVIFLGKINYKDLPPYFAASDVSLAPFEESITEPFGFCPIKILDSFAAGKAVIASDTAWIRELVKDNENGLVFKNDEEFATAVDKITSDEKLRKKLEAGARKTAQELSWLNIAKQYEKIYEELLKKKNKNKNA